MRTRSHFVVLMAVFALMLVACQPAAVTETTGTAPTETTAEPTETTAPPTGEARVLEVWNHEFPPLQDALTQKWIPEFEAAHPGVRVELTTLPFAGVVSYDAKLLSSLSAGEGPDLWDMGDWSYGSFLENGFLAPLDPAILGYGSDQELIDAYLPGSLSVFTEGGQVYGLFSEYNTLALFVNLDMFEEAGISPLPVDTPASWEQIGQIGADLRETDPGTGAPTQIGYQFGFFANFRSPQWYAQNYYAIMRQYGQNDIYVDGQPAANTEPSIQALQVIHDFTHTYQAYDPTFLNNWFADFPQGRVAMVLAGTWFVPAIQQNNPEVRFAVVPHPVVDPSDPETYHNIQWSWGWSVNANKPPEQQQLAQEFLAFMLGKKGETEQATWWFENVGYTQPSLAFLESDAYQAKLDQDPWLEVFVDTFGMFEIDYVQHNYDEPGAALIRAIDRVVYDGMQPAESAELFQAELERLVP